MNINNDTHRMVNGKPQLSENDIAAPNGTERILVNFAVTMMRRLKEPLKGYKKVAGGLNLPTTDTEAEQELTQFVLKWDKWPVPESYVDKALEDAKLAIKHNMKSHGLMR